MIGYAKEHAGDTYRMHNPVTRQVILSRDIMWDNWNTPIPFEDSMQDTSGIDETFYDDFGLDEVVQIQAPVPSTPQVAANLQKPPTLNAASKAGRKHYLTILWTQPQKRPKCCTSSQEFGVASSFADQTAHISRTLVYDNSDNNAEPNKDSDSEPDAKLYFVFNTSVSSDPGEPKQYKDATKSGPEQDKWIKIIKSEIESFTKRNVWKKFPRTELNGRRSLKSRWVFKKKVEPDNTYRYKARVVVKG